MKSTGISSEYSFLVVLLINGHQSFFSIRDLFHLIEKINIKYNPTQIQPYLNKKLFKIMLRCIKSGEEFQLFNHAYSFNILNCDYIQKNS